MSLFRSLVIASQSSTIQPDAWILEYAESAGNSYSRLDYIPVYGDKIEYVWETTVSGTYFNFGTRTSTTLNGYDLISTSSAGFVAYGGATTSTNSVKSSLGEVNTIGMSEDGIIFNGTAISYTSSKQDGVYNMVIGAVATSSVAVDGRNAYAKHHSFTVYSEDDELKVQILPVEKDGVCQLYDLVTNTYYPSLADEYGAGERIGYIKNGQPFNMDGTPMNPDAYLLDYVTLDGTNYFDTGYYAIPAYSTTEARFRLPASSSTKGVFGARGVATAAATSCNVFYGVNENTLRLDVLGSSINQHVNTPNEWTTFIDSINDNGTKSAVVNDTEYVGSVTMSTDRLEYLYLIGSFANMSSSYNKQAGDYGTWKISESGETQLDLIPAEKDGVACYYDLVSGDYIYASVADATSDAEHIGYIRDGIAYDMDGLPYALEAWILDYIEGTGTQYIDTGYIASNTTGVTKIKCNVTATNGSTTSTNGIYGYRVDTSDRNNIFLYNGILYYAGNGATTLVSPYTLGTDYDIELNKDTGVGTVNGVSTSFTTAERLTEDRSQYLFYGNGGNSYGFSGKIYAYSESMNDEVLLNYLPCEQSDGTVCMYDSISGTYKINVGTDDFIGGERIGYVIGGKAFNMDGTEMVTE